MDYYKNIFGMEEVYHHMAMKLEVNGKLFFEIAEVPEEQCDAYMKAVSFKNPILSSWAEYETEEEVRKIAELLSADTPLTAEITTLPWAACTTHVIDKYGVGWYVSTPQHMPCSDCDKSTCEGDWDGKCRLSKWTVELYKKHGANWHKHI